MSKPNKTTTTSASVERFLDAIEDETKKQDSYFLLEEMKSISGEEPVMWGASLIGFGKYHYKYESGREGDFFRIGFSPRKQYLSVYIMTGLKKHQKLLDQLGKFKHGKSCLNIKRLSDIDTQVLKKLMALSIEQMKALYPSED